MSSIREQILVQLETIWGAGDGMPENLSVLREREYPVENTSVPNIMFYERDDPPQPLVRDQKRGPLVLRRLRIRAEYRAKGHPPGTVLDPLIVWATKRIHANERFGGLANCVEEGGIEWKSTAGESSIALAAQDFVIEYRTSRTDPTVRDSVRT